MVNPRERAATFIGTDQLRSLGKIGKHNTSAYQIGAVPFKGLYLLDTRDKDTKILALMTPQLAFTDPDLWMQLQR
ncbi:hypothetical protein [Deinococcus maricopensis]|uniref:Uncharacterized protein n=1 Tax=Deinococcus maricopensis (strain DSM 21211 / LMG 22137 / NRRL B-23946 / LB-34) TaxID=709986 RepID=E8U7L2_DEIML|nr:hypothetical protein [Deinococcus maricopensis]ADV67051.1 hypothetical protein Deima_1401 [Deinococcus maricopensis DSM 21211]